MTDIEIMTGEAWQRHQKIINLRNKAEKTFLELGAELYEFQEKKQWEKLGEDSMKAYLARPEINIPNTLASKLIVIHLRWTKYLQISSTKLLEAGHEKLYELSQYVDGDNVDECLAVATTLTLHGLRKWIKSKFRQPKNSLPNDFDAKEYSGEDWRIIYGDMDEICEQFPPESFDAIVTDPPYPGEYLPCFSALSKQAARLLVPGGVLLAMSGQTHLPEVMRRLSEQEENGLHYRWTTSYLLPGEEQRAWGRKIWNHWKPVIIMTRGDQLGDWATDVVVSPGSDKEHHYWGQSLQGMAGLIDAYVLPESRILDPFVGGGATIDAGRALGHYCVGIDNDPEAIAATVKRLDDKTQRGFTQYRVRPMVAQAAGD